MSLKEYINKRKPGETTEPLEPELKKGAGGDAIFVVQKHQASHLHYDFRIELDGVLKSWAVPKGPSLNPKDRRLAMMVEDHPYDYRHFEGVIPEGNYGAGTVIVWDEGTYRALGTSTREESDEAIRTGLEKGKLTFQLDGKKLRGEFSLVKLRTGEPNSWLLLKKRDKFARIEDVTREDVSVLSGFSIEDLSKKTKTAEAERFKTEPPEFIEPMLAKLTEKAFDKAGWLFEIKWDGYRTIADIRKGKVRIYSRNGISFNEQFRPIAESLSKISRDMVLDGEIVALDKDGRPSFGMLQDWKKNQSRLVYYVFDLLFMDGYDIRNFPLKDRKTLLDTFMASEQIPENIRISSFQEDKGKSLFEDVIKARNLEGMVAKNGSSLYKSGKRSDDWLKIRNHKTQEAIICGYTEGKGGRKIGSLILGAYSNRQLVYIGHAGTGFDSETEIELIAALKNLEINEPVLSGLPKAAADTHWTRPMLVCEVRFSEWTREGVMRHPVYLGLREDKEPEKVIIERATDPPRLELLNERGLKRGSRAIEVAGKEIVVANFRKKLWPEGYTKLDLVEYYRKVAPYILPHLAGRPESMHRHPNGINEQAFFQKDTSDLNLPSWIKTIDVYSESEDKTIRYLICDNEETLVYMANLGCIELNPWESKIPYLDCPDYTVIDLDPLEVPFSEVIEVAKECKHLLNEMGVRAYCKTSGATGLHIYIPLNGEYDYEAARMFSEIIANLLHQRTLPATSIERSPSKRNGKIYIDFLQNKKGQTLASAYSVRPRPGAPVSTPLEWRELDSLKDPAQFNIMNISDRLKEKGDLFLPVLSEKTDMEKALKRIGIS